MLCSGERNRREIETPRVMTLSVHSVSVLLDERCQDIRIAGMGAPDGVDQ